MSSNNNNSVANTGTSTSNGNNSDKFLYTFGLLTGLTGIGLGYLLTKYYSKSNVVIAKGYRGKLQSSVKDYIDTKGNRNVAFYTQICDDTRDEFGEIMEGWTVSIDQCYFLQWLMKSLPNINNVIEIGVFTGCSALAMALGIPKDGKLLAYDIPEGKKYTDLAEKYWKKANVDDKITLSLDGGIAGLDKLLLDNNNLNSFDFAFIDAAKYEYISYYDRLIKLIRIGGYMAFDNTMYEGKVADEINFNDKLTVGIRDFNRYIIKDKRIEYCTIYCGDGTTLIRKVSD